MTPIANIYQTPDGNFGIMSNVTTPLGLARILAALMPNLLEQAANPPAPVAIASQSPVPEPLVIDHDVIVNGTESVEIKAENGPA
jgi:hypothetical protein